MFLSSSNLKEDIYSSKDIIDSAKEVVSKKHSLEECSPYEDTNRDSNPLDKAIEMPIWIPFYPIVNPPLVTDANL
jgi:hypothetical protein